MGVWLEPTKLVGAPVGMSWLVCCVIVASGPGPTTVLAVTLMLYVTYFSRPIENKNMSFELIGFDGNIQTKQSMNTAQTTSPVRVKVLAAVFEMVTLLTTAFCDPDVTPLGLL